MANPARGSSSSFRDGQGRLRSRSTDEDTPLMDPTVARDLESAAPITYESLRMAMKKVTPPHREKFRMQTAFESLDFEDPEYSIALADKRKQSPRDRIKIEILRWAVFFAIGVVTAVLGCMLEIAVTQLSAVKFGWLGSNIETCIRNNCLEESVFLWIGLTVPLTLVAVLLVVYVAPAAQGSGVPEVKCYLNGVKVPAMMRFRTLAVKAVGVACAVVAGLAIGKEGPLVHSGAIIGAGISQGTSYSLPFLKTRFLRMFRNDKEKRDFVSGGIAAGVSAAFGTPFGGLLFSIEEGASFMTQALMWKIFIASMAATVTLNILLSGLKDHQWGSLSNPGLLNFGEFNLTAYSWFELPLFMIVGVIGGLLGASYIRLNYYVTLFRKKCITTPTMKIMEAVTITILTVVVGFMLIFFSTECLPLGDKPGENALQFFCDEHQNSAIGSLFFNTPESSIKGLFHASRHDYSITTLTEYSIAYFLLACITYGLAVPSGLFVPSIFLGASWGRLFGTILLHFHPNAEWVDPGKYALLGAASQLSGITRLTISVAVMFVEASGDVTYGLPMMVAVVFAKWTGDYFTPGVYNMVIKLKHVPMLYWEAPSGAGINLTANDFMSHEIVCVRPLNRVRDILELLRSHPHNAFPVVAWEKDSDDHAGSPVAPALKGVIARNHLVLILLLKAYGRRDGDTVNCKVLTMDDIIDYYPSYPTVSTLRVPEADLDQWIDVQPYLNPSPYMAHEHSTLARIFTLFRTLGLRHLLIVNHHNELTGIVTRKDLANLESSHCKHDFFPQKVAHGRSVTFILPSFSRQSDGDRKEE